MKEINGRFLHKANHRTVSFSDGCLLIDGKEVIKKIGNRFVSCETKRAKNCESLAAESDSVLRNQLAKIAHLLSEGRQFEAVVIASSTSWVKGDGDAEARKANFNPAEPRQSGEWSQIGTAPNVSASVVDVQYRGYFHDVVVEAY